MFDSNPQQHTYTSLAETVALVIVIGLSGWFFVRPQMQTLSAEKAVLRQAEAEYQAVDQDQQSLVQLINRLKQAGTDVVLVDEALPLHNRPTQLEVLLDSLVSASGMQLTELNFQPGENTLAAGNKAMVASPYTVNRKLQATNYELNISGNIEQLHNLLQLIETNGRIIDVISLTMNNDSDQPTFKLKLKTYSYVP